MKTYLTPEQFSELFYTLFNRKMKYASPPELADTIILDLFNAYEKEVKETLEGSMYGIDDYYEEGNAVDLIGYQFHKSFRQTDIIPVRHIDMIIWTCIREADVFWKVMKRVCKILTSEDGLETYKDECDA